MIALLRCRSARCQAMWKEKLLHRVQDARPCFQPSLSPSPPLAHLVDVRHGVATPGIIGLQSDRLPADLLGRIVKAELFERRKRGSRA